MIKIFAIFSLLIFSLPVFAAGEKYNFKYIKHAHNEANYQQIWCKMHNGIEEYENSAFLLLAFNGLLSEFITPRASPWLRCASCSSHITCLSTKTQRFRCADLSLSKSWISLQVGSSWSDTMLWCAAITNYL